MSDGGKKPKKPRKKRTPAAGVPNRDSDPALESGAARDSDPAMRDSDPAMRDSAPVIETIPDEASASAAISAASPECVV